MRVVSYVPFQIDDLFFLGVMTSATATRIVVEDPVHDRKAVYEGVFSYPGGSPAGEIQGLTLYSDDTVQVVFSQADWDAAAYFAFLASAVTGGEIQPLIDLVTAGDDVAIGSPFSDHFEGGTGNDIAIGADGQDQIYGGLGNDDLRGGRNDDLLVGNKGDDLLTGGLGRDNLYGGGGRDVFFVDNDDYVIKGGPGRDTLSLERYDTGVTLTGSAGYLPYWEMRVWGTQQQISGIEIVLGSDYSDCLYVNGFVERVKAGAGNDGVQGGVINEVFFGGPGEDVLAGGDGGDRLFGGVHDDTLLGQNGWDQLVGGRGTDLLVGGRGKDMLTGGLGADIIAFSKGHGTADEILDFEDGRDRIQFGVVADEFADLTIESDPEGARVSAGDVSVLVRDIAASDLTAEDFLFGRVPDYVYFPECG